MSKQLREERGAAHGLELREASDGTGYTLSGYAAVFDTPYAVNDFLGTYTETIRAGAFTKALQEQDDTRLLINHDGLPLARTKSGTLRLSQDEVGLRVEADLDPSNPKVAELKSVMARGDADQMSFAFSATRQEWNKDYTQRTIIEAKLYDVSAVTYPASPTTSMAMRSEDATDANARAVAALDDASRSMRAAGSIDPVTRDLLLQVLGAIDAGLEAIDDATEVLEDVLGVVPEADASDMAECDCGTCADCMASSGRTATQELYRRKAKALDL